MITTTDPGGLVTMFTLTKNKSTQTVQLLNNKITNTFIPFNHLLFRPVQEFFFCMYVHCTHYNIVIGWTIYALDKYHIHYLPWCVTMAKTGLLYPKNWGHRKQWISHKMNIWHPGQLKKSTAPHKYLVAPKLPQGFSFFFQLPGVPIRHSFIA